MPTSRAFFAMAEDARRGKVVLFGGSASGSVYSTETWEWDGGLWMDVSPATGPPGRERHGLAFDPVRNRTTLFGGFPGGADLLQDTWEFDGSSWKAASAPFVSPPGRVGTEMAYDPVRKQSVLFGGFTTANSDDTWLWDGTGWANPSPAGKPGIRTNHRMVFRQDLAKLLLFGGDLGGTRYQDTWSWDGTTWADLRPATDPPARAFHVLSHDPATSRSILFGGSTTSVVADTWVYTGGDWRNVTPGSGNPFGRSEAAMAHDPDGGRELLFGGENSGAFALSDTWQWTGTGWSQLAPAHAPANRKQHRMVHDAFRGRLVLFGGKTDAGTALGDTWEFDGTDWTELVLATSPSARADGFAMAYDSSRRRVLLFGGSANLTDTWELPSNSPPAVFSATASPAPAQVNRVIQLAASASDPDGKPLVYRWLQTYGSAVAIASSTSAAASFTATVSGEYGFLAAVEDGDGGAAFALTSITVGLPAQLAIGTIDAVPDFVSLGQTGAIVRVPISNTGGAPARITAASLAFTPSATGFTFLGDPGNVSTLAAGASAVLTFSVDIGSAAALGLTTIDCNVVAEDAVSGAGASDPTGPDALDDWTVQRRAALDTLVVDATASSVVRGESGKPVTLSVRNTGEATANVTGVALTFNGAQAGYLVVPSGTNPLTISGGVTETFVFDVAIQPAAAPGPTTIDATVTAVDANSAAPAGDTTGALTTDSWTVLREARLELRRVSVQPSSVTRGDSVTGLELVVENTGESAASVTSATLSFGAGGPGYAIARTDPVSSVLPSEQATFVFNVDVGLDAPVGLTVIDGFVAGVDSSGSGLITSDSSADVTDSWTVAAVPAALRVLEIDAAPNGVERGQSGVTVRMFVKNTGQNPASLTTATLSFNGGTAGYVSAPAMSPPSSIAGGSTVELDFSVSVDSNAPLGRTTLDGAVTGVDQVTTAGLSDSDGADEPDLWTVTGAAAAVSAGQSLPATRSWVRRDSPMPGSRQYARSVYDAKRGRVVLFGGENLGTPLGDSWEWDGLVWREPVLAAGPSARSKMAFAFDESRKVAVLFGGTANGTTALGETWEYDGSAWTQKSPATSPQALAGAAMAYDPARKVVLLFGGAPLPAAPVAETWEWNGTNWSQRTPASSPPARKLHAMAADPARNRVVLFGGSGGSGAALGDTWAWDGTGWSDISPATGPSNRRGAELVHDAFAGRLVLFGGEDASPSGETWTFDGTSWQNISPANASPAPRAGAALAFDFARGAAVMFGGSVSGSPDAETWELDGGAWTMRLRPFAGPSARSYHAVAYDEARGETVLFGGDDGALNGETWRWNGAEWLNSTPGLSPSTRSEAGMAYDADRQRVVLFGGKTGASQITSETWEWDGSAWSNPRPALLPPARRLGPLAHVAQNGIALFGGTSADGSADLTDTFKWDGANWFALSPANPPSGRRDHALAYDAGRQRLVTYGGSFNGGDRTDTHELDASSWTQVVPATRPAAVRGYSLAHDAFRKRTVLFGGKDATASRSDTFEWDGVNWAVVPLATSPPARFGSPMAYDTARRRLVLFGGSTDAPARLSDTWELPADSPPTVTARFSPPAPVPGQTVFLVAEATDPDPGTDFSFHWRQPSGPSVGLSFADSAAAQFTAAQTGPVTFQVAASDGAGGHGLASVTVDVQTTAAVRIDSVTAAAAVVSTGQVGLAVEMRLTNTGGRAANVTAASLELASAGPVDRTSQYSQSVAPALPLTVAAGVTRVVTFTVGVGASATTGLITLNGRVTASDAATGSDASSVGAVVTDSWTVQRRAALALRSVAASPGAVSRGQTVAGVTFTAANTGEAAASVAAAGLTFGGTTTGYTQSQAGGPASIAGGATVTFTFTVTVGAGAALGPQTIDATVTASDANAAALGASDAAADAADSWTVQTPAALSAAALVAPSGVSRGSTVAVTLPVANSGQASAQVTSVQLVWSDARLVSALRTPLPVAVAGGTTASFEFDVAAALTATVSGSVTGAATVRGADVNSLAPLTATNTAAGNLAVRNVVPTALATGPLSGPSGVTVSFDGSGSFDGPAAGSSEGDALVYVWSLVSKPSGSALGASSFVPNSAAGNPLTALAPDRKGSWIIGLSVSDGFDSSIVSTTPFTVLNTAPRARAGADFSSPIGTQLTLDGRASSDADPEDTLVYTWTAPLVPAASTVTATSLLPNGTAAAARPSVLPDRPGVYEFELSASDSQATSTDRVQVTVTNQPPVARASVVGGVSLTAPVALSGQASTDAESQPLSYRWSFAAVPPGSLVTAFSANNGPSAAQTSFQPDLPGEYSVSVQLVVNDGFADSAAASLVVTVTDRPPVARASVVGTVAATRPVQLTGEASTDFEGQVLSYRWSLVSAPGGTGAGTFTPNGSPGASRTSFQPDFGGVYTVQLVVSDGRSDSAPATLLVTVTNSLPIARVTGPGTIAFGNSAVLDGRQSSDPEGAPLGYSWRMIGKPATSGLSTGSLNPTAGATASRTAFLPDRIGTYTLDLTVIDGVQPSVPAVIQVTAANFPPEARVAAAAQSGVLGTSFTLDARGTTDPNPGDTLTYRWRVRSVPARSTLTTASIRPNDSTTSVVAQLAPDLPGRYELELQVTDTAGATGTASLRVDVTNTPPVARVSVPAGTTVTQSVTLDGSGSSDAETPAALEFRWRLTSRPAGSSITTAAFRPNDSTLAARTVFKPDRRGSYGIELTVGDGVATARAAATLVVANSPPEIRAPLLRAGAVRQPVTLDATATFDPDPGDSVTYAWRLVAAPKASRLGAQTVVPFTTGTARFTPDAAGTYTARLTVTDTPGAVSRRDILIVASAPGDPPIVALASPSRVLNLQPAAVSVLGSALAPLDSIALFGPLSVPGRSPSTVPLSFTSVDGSRADVTVPAGTAAGQYGVLAISSGRASRTATQPLLTVVAPGPLRLAEGENPLLIVGPENDADAVAAEVQAAVELATAQPDGTALTLEALRSRATGSAQELRQARAATVSAGRATFGAVSLGAAETHVLTVRDAATGVRLARAVATAGGPPAAIADTDIVDGGAPQQAELVASASRGQFGPIRYRWTLVSAPLGAASLDSEAPVTSFRAARAGRYELDLVVSDARGAAATAAVRFGIVDSPPRADAGPDVQLILPDRLGRIPAEQTATSVSLDGRGSGDPNDDPISYFWEVVEQPERSGFVASRDLSGQRTARPVLQLGTATDAGGALLDAGRYVLRLTVSDAAGVAATDEVEILAIDPDTLVPDADAGLDRTVRATIVSTAPLTLAGDIPDPLDISGTAPIAFVRLDGRESVDPNVPPRPLGYRWVVVSVPPDSAVTTLSGAATAFPGFIPDRPGSYRFRLTVSNGRFEATPDEVDVLVLFVSRNRPPKAEASVEARRRGLSSRTQTQPIVFRIAQDRVTLDGRLSADPDPGDTLRYSWIQTRGPSVQLSPSATAPVVEFVPLETGRYGFRLRVVDPSGAPNESATLELLGVPLADTPPRLAVVASSPTTVTTGQDFDPEDAAARPRSLRVRVGSEVVLRGTAADPEAALGLQRLALRFRQVAGPTVLLTTRPTESPLISEVSFVPTTSRVHVFDAHARQLTAEGVDTGVETVRRVRVVVDSSTNGVPNARLTLFGFKDELAACQVVTLDGTPSRDQGPNSNTGLLYRWVQVGGPPVTLSNPFSSIVTFVTPDFGDDASRLFRFQLFVDDGNDRSEPDAISLVVAPGSQNSGALPLARGASLITVPLDPGGERPYRVADLLSTSGAPFAVALTRPADGGAPRWRVLHPALGGDDQLVRGAEGYLLVRPNRPSVAVPLAGRKWASQTGQQRLSVGLNLVGYPRGHPEGEDVETLRARAGASFVVDTTDAGRFRLYLPPLTPPYPVEEGKSYLLSVPRSTTLTLPGCQ
ncbi:MAG: hypothetical protein HY816_03815 [Candidatus Wallbacteria bacterium]|nr:hypothetical protein [Candidatus Wallbacteria bacterium]